MINEIYARINKILCSDYFFIDKNGRYSSINVNMYSKKIITYFMLESKFAIVCNIIVIVLAVVSDS